jgi:hypothetical protein
LLTDEVLEHDFKFRGHGPSVVGGITIRVTITITIGRRIRPIIVTSKIVPVSIVVEIIISNEVLHQHALLEQPKRPKEHY